ncbi:MAG: WbqC family protein [Bacteroidales bacterium]
MNGKDYLLSTAYFPPLHYIWLISTADRILIEHHENYLKQSYRNRCQIASANGMLSLSIPVLEGSFRKISVSEVGIDYSRRWREVHTGAIESSYRAAPYFDFYYDRIRKIIEGKHDRLIDLNSLALSEILKILGIETPVIPTSSFRKPVSETGDFRYLISPKKPLEKQAFSFAQYIQVFSDRFGFMPGLSILDLIFNTGPDAAGILKKTACSC